MTQQVAMAILSASGLPGEDVDWHCDHLLQTEHQYKEGPSEPSCLSSRPRESVGVETEP